jgi:Bacterial membrane protein YfhO
MMRALMFMNDPIWTGPNRHALDLRQTALVEVDDKEGLKGLLSPTPVGPSESVTVVEHRPQRVILRAALERPGLVILADTYYPGWQLTIDGKRAPIYRANRMMRSAAVPAGLHTLVYVYRPASFSIGATISVVGLCALLAVAWRSRRKRPAPPSALES